MFNFEVSKNLRNLVISVSAGASGKPIAFGIFKRNGSVYTEIISNCRKRR